MRRREWAKSVLLFRLFLCIVCLVQIGTNIVLTNARSHTHIYCVKPNWNGFQSLRSLKCDQFQFDRSQCDFSEEKRRKKVIKSKSNVSTSESFNCELTNETMTKCSIRASHVIVTNMKRQRKNVDTILGPRIRREICSKWKWIIHLWHIFLFLLYNSQSTALIAIAVVVVIVV